MPEVVALSKVQSRKFLYRQKKKNFFFGWKLPETNYGAKIRHFNFFSKMAASGHLGYRIFFKNNRLCAIMVRNVHTKFEDDWLKTVRGSPLANSGGRTRTRGRADARTAR